MSTLQHDPLNITITRAITTSKTGAAYTMYYEQSYIYINILRDLYLLFIYWGVFFLEKWNANEHIYLG